MRKQQDKSATGLITKAALDYRRLGWSLIPIDPQNGRPLIRWQVYQFRCPDVAEFGDWLRRWPDANLAIVTGFVSGLVVLHVDPRQGGELSLGRLQAEHGQVNETLEAGTGGGGRCLYFAHPGEIVRNRVGIAPGVELRGDGGFVEAPPSTHASGQRDYWTRSPENQTPAPLPEWLLAAALGDRAPIGPPLEHWRRLLREGVEGGECKGAIASLAGHLLWHGVDLDEVIELLLCWGVVRCRPPLDADLVLREIEKVASREGHRGSWDRR